MDVQLIGKLSHDLPRMRTHPPSHISLELLAVATHCSAPSSPVVVGRGRAREASSFLADGQLVDHAIATWLDQ